MSWLSHALILRPRATRSIVVGVISFSLGAAGAAAAVRGYVASDNLFHACANNSGTVRVLAEGDTCKNGEVGFMFPSQAYVDAEADTRRQADTTMQSTVDGLGNAWQQGDADEAAARMAADSTEAAARQAADSTEAAARQAADTTLQTDLGNESAARKQGDADALAGAKSYTDGAVANEAAARTATDSGLQTMLDAETAARKAADADEMAARRQGDVDTLAAANAYTDAHAGGRPGLQIVSTRVSNPTPLDPGATLTASVSCAGGKVVIGGGASSSNSNVVLYQSFPSSTLQWTASARAVGTVAAFGAGLTVFAVCMG